MKGDPTLLPLFGHKEKSITLAAVGDILLHGRVYGGLKKKSNYNFLEQLESVSHLLGKTDITVANLETIIAGQEMGLSGFPRFNGPVEIGYALKELGVDLVTIANNHVLDKGEEGLLKSISNLEKIGLEYDGAYKSLADKQRLRIFKRNGLKVCFISYTQGTNGIVPPADKKYLVNRLNDTKTISIIRELRRIKSKKLADIIVMSLHFGSEYHLNPSAKQKQLAASFADAGADVIIGHHPHVLQPPEWIETSHGTKTFVAYSLGNFLSGQNGLHRQIGTVLSLELVKPDPKYRGILVRNPKYSLTFTNRESRLKYSIQTLKEWVDKHEFIETSMGKFSSKEVYENTKKRMRKKIPDLQVD